MKEWLTIEEAADYIGYSISTLVTLRNRGHIKDHYPPGVARPRFRRSELDQMMTSEYRPKRRYKAK